MKLFQLFGAAENHSNQLSQWILRDTMENVPRRTKKMRLCRLLGAVKTHSKQIQQWILKDTNIVPRRTNRPLTDEEKRDSVLQREME